MSEVIAAITQFRADLDRQTASAATRLATVWQAATRDLDMQMLALAQEASARAAEGLPVTQWHLVRLARYQALQAQIRTQLAGFPPAAAADIARGQMTLAQLGLEHSQRLLDLSAPGVVAQFDRLPVEAVVNMVGNTGANTPLGRLLTTAVGDGAARVGQQLAVGVARGLHPARIAQLMRRGLNLGFNRALLIARTETLRVYREASRQQYVASGTVYGYRRLAAKSVRTCIACLMADGRFYELSEPFEEHPAGRCTLVPMTRPRQGVTWETGETWFRRQDAATQVQILGPGRWDAWQRGRFDLDATVTRLDDPTWGASLHPTPLSSLLAAD